MTSDWYRELCDPNPRLPSESKRKRKLNSVIVQIDYKKDIELRRYPSLSYYKNIEGNKWAYQGVYNTLIGKAKSAYGYRWMWIEDWEEYQKKKKQ